jgi:CBS domain containing-hemolysin-like protein
VYESTVDLVTGLVTVIDGLGVPASRRPTETVATIAREPVYVPESLDLDGVLETLQAANCEQAIVVDEYGGTDGLVTLEDLAEELVGEIADEYDLEPAAYEVTVPLTTAPSTVLVDGVVREDELAEATGFRLPEGPYETLAGFIMARLGHIPVEGETVDEHGWKFTVVEVQRRRIEEVRVTRPEAADE